eukprot:m.429115 g.429115  ORF g.429115 m.429115 type:complete len:324 (-) comp16961_c0_seq1:5805-6776(-)
MQSTRPRTAAEELHELFALHSRCRSSRLELVWKPAVIARKVPKRRDPNACREAAVHLEHLPGHERRVVRAEKDCGPRNVCGVAPPFERGAPHPGFCHLGRLGIWLAFSVGARVLRSRHRVIGDRDRPWSNAVDPDSVVGEVECRSFGQRNDGGLGAAVDCVVVRATEAMHARDGDDPAAASAGHSFPRLPHRKVRPLHVDFVDELKVSGGCGEKGAHLADTGHRDTQIESAEFGDGEGDRRRYIGLLRHVALCEHPAAPSSLHRCNGCLCLGLVSRACVGADHIGPFQRQCLGDRGSQPAGCPRDKGNETLELPWFYSAFTCC